VFRPAVPDIARGKEEVINWAYVSSLKVFAQPQRASCKEDAFRSFYHNQRFIAQHKCICVIQPVNQSSELQISSSQPALCLTYYVKFMLWQLTSYNWTQLLRSYIKPVSWLYVCNYWFPNSWDWPIPRPNVCVKYFRIHGFGIGLEWKHTREHNIWNMKKDEHHTVM